MGGEFFSHRTSTSDVALSKAVCYCYGEETACMTVLREEVLGERSRVSNSSVYFQNVSLTSSDTVRNLSVIFGSNLDFKDHISSICHTSFFSHSTVAQHWYFA